MNFRAHTICLIFAAFASSVMAGDCPITDIQSKGNFIEIRFFPVPVQRTREAVADAMQAIGVLLFENSNYRIHGERTSERIREMKLPSGDETVRASLSSAKQEGVEGTKVEIITMRHGNKTGTPKHFWSSIVLDETQCLVELLSNTDPSKKQWVTALAVNSQGIKHDVKIPEKTEIALLLWRFYYSTDLRVGQRLALEVASDVKIGADLVILKGTSVTAKVIEAKDRQQGAFGRSAKAKIAFEFVTAIDGSRIEIQEIQGKSGKIRFGDWKEYGLYPVYDSIHHGTGFSLRAGTLFLVNTSKEQVISIPIEPGISSQDSQAN